MSGIETASSTAHDQKLIRRLAHSMFRAELSSEMATNSPEVKKAAWAEQRVDYVKRARKLYRILERDGVDLAMKAD